MSQDRAANYNETATTKNISFCTAASKWDRRIRAFTDELARNGLWYRYSHKQVWIREADYQAAQAAWEKTRPTR